MLFVCDLLSENGSCKSSSNPTNITCMFLNSHSSPNWESAKHQIEKEEIVTLQPRGHKGRGSTSFERDLHWD